MHNIRHHCAVLGAATLLAACASGASRISSSPGLQPISLTVTNQNWLDVDVFVLHGGSRYRLGQVGGSGSATLSIPSGFITNGQVQLMADPIGSNDVFITDQISVAPDEKVELTVAPRMRMSSFAVWTR
ncbi:MAG TPA: hypothetical protein VFW03_29455 [Gemmatimonadaceae bacterium]|nr:hypothetical protein [Gemmatimonadaceae bacterium]